MRRHSIITMDDILRAVRILRYVTRFISLLFFAGGERRIKALEKLLPVVERERLVITKWHTGEIVYSIARKNGGRPVSMDHELACALIVVLFGVAAWQKGRLYRSVHSGVLGSSRKRASAKQ